MTKSATKLPTVYLIDKEKYACKNPCPFKVHLTERTNFNFGVYNGKTMKEIFEADTPYIEWCVNKVKYFMISQDELNPIIEQLKAKYRYTDYRIEKFKSLFEEKADDIMMKLDKAGLISYKEEEEYENSKEDENSEENKKNYGSYLNCQLCDDYPCSCSHPDY